VGLDWASPEVAGRASRSKPRGQSTLHGVSAGETRTWPSELLRESCDSGYTPRPGSAAGKWELPSGHLTGETPRTCTPGVADSRPDELTSPFSKIERSK